MFNLVRIAVITLIIWLLQPAALLATDLAGADAAASGVHSTLSGGEDVLANPANSDSHSALELLSDEDRTALAQSQEVDVVVEFDQTEAVNLAATRRRQATLQYDDAAILAERVQIYRQQKERSLVALSGEQITVKQDYNHLPMGV